MDPREFHLLATTLVGGTDPAAIRTAVSRAYYAAYHVGAALLRDMGFDVPESPEGHPWVERRLSNSGNLAVEKAGSHLGTLRTRRIDADYRLTKKSIEGQKTALSLVKLAHDVITVLDTQTKGPHRAEIIQAIQDYHKKISPRF